MKLGFVSAILPDLDLDELLRFAAGEGFDCVELMCWPVGKAERKYAGVTHVDVSDFSKGKAEEVLGLAERHRVEISALGYYPNLLDGDAGRARAALRHLKRVISAAPLLGLSTVNTFIGADHRRNVEENFRKFLKVWPPIVRHAEERGVRIGIENCPMLFTFDEWPSGKNLGYSPAIWRRMFAAIRSDSLGLNYDPSHLVWQFMDYLRPIAEFKSKLFHVHAKDMLIRREKLDDHGILALGWSTPKIPGYGEVDWGRFCSALSEAGYDGPVCIEVEDDSFGKSLAGRQRALKLARNALKPYFEK